jgi:hypothetical protein
MLPVASCKVESVICGRVGCVEPAVSVLLIAPQDQQAWLVGPDHEAARDGVPMCASHADRVTVPFGWQLRDDRPVERARARRKTRARKPSSDAPPQSDPVAEPTPPPAKPSRRGAAHEPAARPAATGSAPVASAEAAPVESAVDRPDTAMPVEPEPESGNTAPAAEDTATLDADVPASGEVATTAESASPERPRSPADVPVHADEVAAAVAGSGARLTVVPGDDDPSKTFAVEPDGQTALWAETQRDDHEPSDETPCSSGRFASSARTETSPGDEAPRAAPPTGLRSQP